MKKIVNTHLISGRGYFINEMDDEDYSFVEHIIVYIYGDGSISYRPIRDLSLEDYIGDDIMLTGPCGPDDKMSKYITKSRITDCISRFNRITIECRDFTDVEQAINEFESHGVRVI